MDVYKRDAERYCVDPIALGEPEINKCYEYTFDKHPVLPIGQATIEYCLCNENGCNPILNVNRTVIRKPHESLVGVLKAMNILYC